MRGTIAAAVIACTGLAPADEPAPKALRVLTYNVHHGEGTDGKLDLPRVAGVIKAARPDVVMLQEVDRNTTRTGKVDQTAELARLTGLHAEFGKAIDLQGGGYGLALLSRFPLKGVKTDALPGKTGQEARIVMSARVEPGAGWPAVTLLSTHFQHDDGPTREAQAAKLDELFGTAEGTFVLAGDLNATPGSVPVRALTAHWAFATEPGGKGLLTIPVEPPSTSGGCWRWGCGRSGWICFGKRWNRLEFYSTATRPSSTGRTTAAALTGQLRALNQLGVNRGTLQMA